MDKLYRGAGFNSDRERVEHLFGLYEKLSLPAHCSHKEKGGQTPYGQNSTVTLSIP